MPLEQAGPNGGPTLQKIAQTLAKARRIVMLTGAGISTSCGIPDFRSRDGLYAQVQPERSKSCQTPSATRTLSGKDLLDASVWRDPSRTQAFYSFVSEMRQTVQENVEGTTATHRFIRRLRDSRRLLRCYTQNIDGLEQREGLCSDLNRGAGSRRRFGPRAQKLPFDNVQRFPGQLLDGGCEVVPLHGDLSQLRCTLCKCLSPWDEQDHVERLQQGEAPICPACETQNACRKAQGKRGLAIGTLRPNVVLYGEEHPDADALASLMTQDLQSKPDVLLIMGTSLQVHGVKALVRELAKAVHEKANGLVVFVNATPPATSVWQDVIDFWVQWECDSWVQDLQRRRPDLWQQQQMLKTCVSKGPRAATDAKASNSSLGKIDQEVLIDQENQVPKSTLVMVQPKNSADRHLQLSMSRSPLRDRTVAANLPATKVISHGFTAATPPSPRGLKRRHSLTQSPASRVMDSPGYGGMPGAKQARTEAGKSIVIFVDDSE